MAPKTMARQSHLQLHHIRHEHIALQLLKGFNDNQILLVGFWQMWWYCAFALHKTKERSLHEHNLLLLSAPRQVLIPDDLIL